MADDSKGTNLVRLAIGAGILAAGAVALAVLVPRSKWAAIGAPIKSAGLPVVAAVTGWAAGMWANLTAPTPPAFDDMRPFDEF